MKAVPLSLPVVLHKRMNNEAERQWFGVGNTALLEEPLIGLVASRQCPGQVLLETIDHAIQWIKEGRVILSGFHAPLEQQVLRSTLRHKGRVVKLLARGFANYRVPSEERTSFDKGQILVITPYPPTIRHTTRATALERNHLVLTLAAKKVVPYVAEGSPLAALLAKQ